MLLSRKFADRLARLPSGRMTKWLTIAAWLVVTALAVPLAGRLSSVAADDSSVELPRGADATRVAELAKAFPDGTVSPGILIYARAGGLTGADRTKIAADRAAIAPLAASTVDSREAGDGAAATLFVPIRNDGSRSHTAARVRDIARTGLPAGLAVHLTGPAGNALDAADSRDRLGRAAMLVTGLVVMALLLIMYRSPVLWLLPLLNVGVATVLTDAVTYLLGRYAHVTVDPGNAVVVTVVLFGIGTDYALLLLARYREELRLNADRHRAMARALRGAAPAIAASAATVALSLLCLLGADMGFNHDLGPAGAVAVLCGLLVMLTLLPAQLVALGRWVFWPAIPRPRPATAVTESATGDGPAAFRPSRAARLVGARPRVAWLGTAIVLAALALAGLGMRTGLDDGHQVTGTPDSVAGQRLLAAHFPAGTSRPVQVVAPVAAAPQILAAVRSDPGIATANPPVTSLDGTLVRVDATLTDPPDSPAARSTVTRLRSALVTVHDGPVRVGGATALDMAKADAQAHDRRLVIPLALAVVLAILVVLLRALIAPLLLLATVVASYFAALGASWLIVRYALGFPAMDVQVMLVSFIFLVALGVDYSIFLLARIREETARHGHRDGVLRALTRTGPVITSAGIVLAATFAVLLVAPLVAFVEIGVVVALGVLLDALLVRSIVVPALLLEVGERAWWPRRTPAPAEAVPSAGIAGHPVRHGP
ncbi:MMPL family transporter [Dactylosporangium sp. NPDC048998]|uniref:MMPL family transporter n=1 Tax=Dactylosporangium sp. NPDC048998 TaxID=3363976 RepID=UPI00371B3866